MVEIQVLDNFCFLSFSFHAKRIDEKPISKSYVVALRREREQHHLKFWLSFYSKYYTAKYSSSWIVVSNSNRIKHENTNKESRKSVFIIIICMYCIALQQHRS